MASNYDFRVLINTVSGSSISYGTSSLVSVQPNTSLVVNTNTMVDKINTMKQVHVFNGKTHTTASSLFDLRTIPATFFSGSTGVDTNYQYLSASIKGNSESGSILFHANTTPSSDGDFIKRYKFFGNKVCNVLGVPENYWIYADKFRLTNTGSEQNYISGDVLAQSLHLRDNFAISNAGAIESDLPMKHAKDTDRWIKWTDVSSSIPQNDMLIGYSNQNDRYEIRMQNEHLLISSSATTASGDFKVKGDTQVNGDISASGDLFTDKVLVAGTTGFSHLGDGSILTLGVSNTPLTILSETVGVANNITASGNISSSGDIISDEFIANGANLLSYQTTTNPLISRALLGGVETFIFGDNTTPNATQISGTNIKLFGPVTASENINVIGRTKFGASGGTVSTSHQFYGQSGDNNFFLIADKDGEEVMRGVGAVGDGDLTYKFGDNAGAGNGTFFEVDEGNGKFILTKDGNDAKVGINTIVPTKALQVAGDISGSGDIHLQKSLHINTGLNTSEANNHIIINNKIGDENGILFISQSAPYVESVTNSLRIGFSTQNTNNNFFIYDHLQSKTILNYYRDNGFIQINNGESNVTALNSKAVIGNSATADALSTTPSEVLTVSGNVSASGQYYGIMPGYFHCGGNNSSATSKFLAFLASTTFVEDTDTDFQRNRIVAPYDGYVSHLVLKAGNNFGGAATVQFHKATSGVDSDTADTTSQTGASVTADMSTPFVPGVFNFDSSTHTFSQGDILAFKFSPGGFVDNSKDDIDGMLTLMFNVS